MEHEQQGGEGHELATAQLARLLALAVTDLVDRVRPLPHSRLVGRPVELGGRTRAAAVHDLAQQLADVAAGIENQEASRPPQHRPLPDLGPFVVGDQLAVTGADVLAAVLGRAAPGSVAPVGVPGGARCGLEVLLIQCREAAEALRSCM